MAIDGTDVNVQGENGLTPLHFAARYMETKTSQLHATTVESRGAQRDMDEFRAETRSNVISPLLSTNSQDGPPTFEAFSLQLSVNQDQQRTPNIHRGTSWDSKDQKKYPISNTNYSDTNTIISCLVSKGASVNAKDDVGSTPLHYSAMRGNEVATKELLRFPAINVEARDKHEMTPLHIAAIHNSTTEVMKLLINVNADLCCKDSTQATPLHRASARGNLDLVNLLLDAAYTRGGENGVKKMVSEEDSVKMLPLHLAIENVHVEVVELLIGKGSDTNALEYNDASPLHVAAVSGSEKIVNLLLINKADVNRSNTSWKTPLHRAADYNHAGVIDILLRNGAEIERRSRDNLTPLLLAASRGHVESIQCLLNRGANISAVDKNGKTSLFLAVEGNHYRALVILTGHKRCKELLDRSDRHGNSPLHIAAMKGNVPIIKNLLSKGARIDYRNEDDRTPLHLAAKEGRTKTVQQLLIHCKELVSDLDEKSNTPLHLAALSGKHKVIKSLLDSGADAKLRNTNRWTALGCACAKGCLRSVKVLLEAGSAVQPSSEVKTTTPLHIAAARGHVKVVELLMNRGALVARTNKFGRNALDLATEGSHKSVAMAIINSSQWQDALKNQSVCQKTRMRRTPLRLLILKLPEVAEEVFNKCITTSNTVSSEEPNFTVTFNYELVDDTYTDTSNYGIDNSNGHDEGYHPRSTLTKENHPRSTLTKENHPLMIMVNSKRKQLLGHPLCVSLVTRKWLQYGRYVYYTNFAFYLVFLTFLTGYLVTTPKPTIEQSNYNITNSLPLLCEALRHQNLAEEQSLFATFGKVMILLLSPLMLLKECFELYQLRLRYLTFENLVEWLCYVSALLLVIDVDCISEVTGHRKVWQWELGAFSIFLAWLELVMFIRKFHFLGIYVVMWVDIFTTFVKVFVVFILLIIGFSLSFSTTFYNQDMMLSPGKALLRTSVMMLGEFNFDDMFDDTKIMFPATSYIIFVAFIILMTIITMNLLVGLAVDDIKGVQEQAELTRLAMRVELVLNVESMMPDFLRRKFIVSKPSVRLNELAHRDRERLLSELENRELIVSGNSKVATKPEAETTEQRHEAVLSRIMQMQEQLQEENQVLKNLVLKLLRANGHPLEEGDKSTDIETTTPRSLKLPLKNVKNLQL